MPLIFRFLRCLIAPRATLIAENMALRIQLNILARQAPRPRIRRRDRLFWVLLRRLWKGWRACLVLVQPETVVRWHRQGWRVFWRLKSGKPGRSPIPRRVILLIRRLSSENPLWGVPRLQLELRLLGHDLAEATITKYRVRSRRPGHGQRWFTFLRNHARQIASCDLFVVPTVSFRLLYVFVVLSHDRRKILHFAVTAHPTDVWLAMQIRRAFAGIVQPPRYLLRDRDASYGKEFRAALRLLGIKSLRSSPQSPWQNPYVERVIGTIRRECLNHVIALSARGLRTILAEYIAYYNAGRAHQSLAGRQPCPRPRRSVGRIKATRVLGGLHHVYSRAA